MPHIDPPEPFFWAHDIIPSQIADLVASTSDAKLGCLRGYGEGRSLRYAAIVHRTSGPPCRWELGLSATEVADRAASGAERPIGIDSHRDGEGWRFTLLTEAAPDPERFVETNLTAAAVNGIVKSGTRIIDLTVHLSDAGPRYAAVFTPDTPSQLLVSGPLKSRALKKAAPPGSSVTHIRSYGDGLFSAILNLNGAGGRRREWHLNLTGDALSRKLDKTRSYPADLDVFRSDAGVRFNAVTLKQQSAG